MAKKKVRINRLEYYGYADQNVYNGQNTVDLSSIHEVNKRQDDELDELSEEQSKKADLEDLLTLSGIVETIIDKQIEISGDVADNTERIEDLEAWKDSVEDSIGSISGLTVLDEKINDIDSKLDEHIEDAEEFKDEVNSALDTKLGKDEAAEIYATKEDTYTKSEVDDLIEENKQDLSNLATKDELSNLEEKLENEATNRELEDEKEKLAREAADNEIKDLIDEIKDTIPQESDEVKVGGEPNDKTEIWVDESEDSEYETHSKAYIDSMFDSFSVNLFNEITRAKDKENEIEEGLSTFKTSANEAIEKKADKTDVEVLKTSVDRIDDALSQEISDREEKDAELEEKIRSIKETADEIDTFGTKINDLETKLNKEIQDRIEGDESLIGDESDIATDDTIWGAKKFAQQKANETYSKSVLYTDTELKKYGDKIDGEVDDINTKLSKKIDEDTAKQLIKDGIDSIDLSYIENDIKNLKNTDDYLKQEIDDLKENDEDIRDAYRRINIITTYSGDSAADYVDSGNGILDVFHREFHELKEEIIDEGSGTITTNEHEKAFGTYNESHSGEDDSEKTIFSIGIGTSIEDRRNAFEVMKNGDIYMNVEGEYMCINDLLSMLAHETY